jgi:uncharacterized protein (DUF58 family)
MTKRNLTSQPSNPSTSLRTGPATLQPSNPPTRPSTIFDESFLHRLDRLSLIARRIRTGRSQGERRSTKRGSSVEFADYRNYTPGDDLRRLDWRIYARLERPFIKLFEEEEEQSVYFLLDASASMNWPEGDDGLNKWNFARRLVAALGYIALTSGDRLTLSSLAATGAWRWGPQRGRGHIHGLLNDLTAQTAAGPTDLNEALRRFSLSRQRPGLLFLLTDFFSPAGYERGLAALAGAGYEVNVLHLLAPDEIDPPLHGDLRLYDIETGLAQDVTITPTLHRLYRDHFDAWCSQIEQYCFARDMNYLTLETSTPFETVILGYLRQRGFVK